MDKSALLEKIEEALNTLRPYLQDDGGNVKVVDITKEKVVKVKLLGNCESCPQSYMTMKAGIEEAIKKAIPEISSVEAV